MERVEKLENSTEESLGIEETAVYTVTVRVVNGKDDGLNAEVWAVKDGGSDKVEEILFSNAYKAPEEPKKPEEPNKPAAP